MSKQLPDGFVEELLRKTDIVALIRHKIPALIKVGENYRAHCPFHQEKTPSFYVNPIKQHFTCYGCNIHGDAINFIREFDKLNFIEACEVLARFNGIAMPNLKDDIYDDKKPLYQLLTAVAAYYAEQLETELNNKAKSYLINRSLDPASIKKFQLGYAPPHWDNILNNFGRSPTQIKFLQQTGMIIAKDNKFYDRFRHRIMIPIRNTKGQVVAFGARALDANQEPKYLNSPETKIYQKGHEIYGLYELIKTSSAKSIIITEGYLDTISLVQAGITNTVATLGTALTQNQLKKLLNYTQHIIFCFDGDIAGQNALWRALNLALPLFQEGIKFQFLKLPHNEDPDSFIKKHGNKAFIALLDKAALLVDFMFNYLAKDLELSKLDDRGLLIARAKPLITTVPSKVMREMLYEHLAFLTNTSAHAFDAPTNTRADTPNSSAPKQKYYANNKYNYKSTTYKAQQSPVSNTWKAIALLYTHTYLAKELINIDLKALSLLDLPEIKLFCLLAELLLANPELSTQAMKERLPPNFATKLDEHRLNSIISYIPITGIEIEFRGIANYFAKQIQQYELDSLLALAKVGKLSNNDKEKLHKILQNIVDKVP